MDNDGLINVNYNPGSWILYPSAARITVLQISGEASGRDNTMDPLGNKFWQSLTSYTSEGVDKLACVPNHSCIFVCVYAHLGMCVSVCACVRSSVCPFKPCAIMHWHRESRIVNANSGRFINGINVAVFHAETFVLSPTKKANHLQPWE